MSNTITLAPVKSSNIHSIGHDPATDELHVRFHSGDTYIYTGVPAEKHQAALSADSVGKYINSQVKGKHPFRKV